MTMKQYVGKLAFIRFADQTDIITKVKEVNDDNVVLSKPFQVMLQPQMDEGNKPSLGISVIPWIPFADQTKDIILTTEMVRSIAVIGEPDDQMTRYYQGQTSNLVVANSTPSLSLTE